MGESHGSAHALGLPVRRIRFLAILFGGLLAGLAGAYLSLIYTRFWSPGMSAGRGWIALALVVFAGGHVWRLVLGAYLFGGITVAQLHAQAGAIGLPSQFLSALPYLMTIAALLFLSLSGRKGAGAAGRWANPLFQNDEFRAPLPRCRRERLITASRGENHVENRETCRPGSGDGPGHAGHGAGKAEGWLHLCRPGGRFRLVLPA